MIIKKNVSEASQQKSSVAVKQLKRTVWMQVNTEPGTDRQVSAAKMNLIIYFKTHFLQERRKQSNS